MNGLVPEIWRFINACNNNNNNTHVTALLRNNLMFYNLINQHLQGDGVTLEGSYCFDRLYHSILQYIYIYIYIYIISLNYIELDYINVQYICSRR